MTIFFTRTDPTGLKVACSDGQWKDHVCTDHPCMHTKQAEVIKAIEDPNVICKDAHFAKRRCYYRLNDKKNKYIKVVVELNSVKNGRVITAFPTANMKDGEISIWLKKS